MKYTHLGMVVGVVSAISSVSFATDVTVNVAATLRQGVVLTKNTDIDFTPSSGHVDFYPSVGTSDNVTLGSDGNIANSGANFVDTQSTGTVGDIDITGVTGDSVTVACSTGATLAETGGKTLTFDNMQFAMNTGVAYGTSTGAGLYMCAGTGTSSLTYTLTGSSDKVLMGGRLNGKAIANLATGAYSTATSGGTAATLRVLYP